MIKKLFLLLIVILTSDLNGFLSSLLNKEAVLSPLILFIVIILLIFGLFKNFSINVLSLYLILFFIFWLTFGTLLYIHNNPAYGDPVLRIRYYTPSIIILYVTSIYFLFFFKNNESNTLIRIMTIALVINSLIIIITPEFSFLTTAKGGRSSGFISSVNQAGFITVVAQIFLLYNYLNFPNIKLINKILILSAYIISVIASVMTFSKAAMISSLIVFTGFIWFFYQNSFISDEDKKKWRYSRLTFYAMLIIGMIYIPIRWNQSVGQMNKFQIERVNEVTQILEGGINDKTSTGRIHLAKKTISNIEEDSYFGKGLDTFHRIDGIGAGPHNQFLLILGEIGIFGLLFYLGFYLLIIYNIFKLDTIASKFLITLMIIVLFINNMVSFSVLFTKFVIVILSFISVFVLFKSKYNQID